MSSISSLLPISSIYALDKPFCDFLNITVPKFASTQLRADLMPLLDLLCCTEGAENTFMVPTIVGGGAFKIKPYGKFTIFSASGGFLTHLRNSKHLQAYVALFWAIPHRITRFDATCDFGLDAAPYVAEALRLGDAGLVSFTRKSIPVADIGRHLSNFRGRLTGTAELGRRGSYRVFGRIYDKQFERMNRFKIEIPDRLRIELELDNRVGCCLWDVLNAEGVFYHYAKQFVEPPDGLSLWAPLGEGYVLEKSEPRSVSERIEAIFNQSFDIKRVLQLIKQEYGRDKASKELLRLADNHSWFV